MCIRDSYFPFSFSSVIESPSGEATVEDCIRWISDYAYRGENPHDWQGDVVKRLVTMIPNNESSSVLLVRPTGNGKSLVKNIAATFFAGVTLTIVPLLALRGTDQTNKMRVFRAFRKSFPNGVSPLA